MISHLPPRVELRTQAERFTAALELLAAPDFSARLGGIYALESLGRNTPDAQNAVSEVLAAFVRRHAGWDVALGVEAAPVTVEVQAALVALGRREAEGEDRPLDLSHIALRRAYLPFSNFERAFLFDCDLEGALLVGARLQGAWLARTNLRHANLDGAHLEGCDLMGARGLTIEQLRGAVVNSNTRLPDGRFFSGF